MIRNQKKFATVKPDRHGFTIIEMLLVFVVSVIVLAVAVPRIRVISKERGIRESARVVGSMISKASDEAIINGTAGIVIRRNPNFASGGQWYASTQLGILRAVPVYVGDQPYSKGATPSRGAMRVCANQVDIPRPIEHNENPPVLAGDSISLNYSPAQFAITEVEPEFSNGRPVLRLTLNVGLGTYPSIAREFEDVPFVIHRQPILRRSSIEELPTGHIIDLRFSGHEPIFEKEIEIDGEAPIINYEIEIIFDRFGYVTKTIYRELLERSNLRSGRSVTRIPSGPIYLLVVDIPVSDQVSPLNSDLAMWVAINLQSTNPFVGYNVKQPQRTIGELGEVGIRAIVNRARRVAPLGANP